MDMVVSLLLCKEGLRNVFRKNVILLQVGLALVTKLWLTYLWLSIFHCWYTANGFVKCTDSYSPGLAFMPVNVRHHYMFTS